MDFFVALGTFEADSQLPFPWTPRVVNAAGKLIPERLEAAAHNWSTRTRGYIQRLGLQNGEG
jgi:hypothetical protein